MPKPSVGRQVHYVAYGTPGGEFPSVCRSATIAEVGAWLAVQGGTSGEVVHDDGTRFRTVEQRWEGDACALVVTNPTGLFFNTCSHNEETKAGGTWHWPEFV